MCAGVRLFRDRRRPLLDVANADEVLGYLYGIEGGALLYLVADEPEGDAVGVGKVLTDAAYEDVVAAFVEERHGVLLVLRAVFQLQAFALADGLLELFYADGALCLGQTLSLWQRRLGTRTHMALTSQSVCMIFFVSLYIFISSFV